MIPLVLAATLAQTSMNLNVQPVMVKDEGVAQSAFRAVTVNCTGAGVTCTQVGSVWTLNASGGGGGSTSAIEVTVDYTANGYPVLSTTLTGLAWVTPTSKIVCAPFATTADGQTAETYQVASLEAVPANRVNGVGFDLLTRNPNGATGTFRFHCFGG